MAVMDAGSRVNVSIGISTNTRTQLPDCRTCLPEVATMDPPLSWQPFQEHTAKGLFWRGSHVSIYMYMYLDRKGLLDFTVHI